MYSSGEMPTAERATPAACATASAIPSAYAIERKVGATYYGGLPDKIAPTEDMVSVDTLSLPGASIIVYNNWPRVPTGTPCFITRYCQVFVV